MAFDGINFKGQTLKIRRPHDYHPTAGGGGGGGSSGGGGGGASGGGGSENPTSIGSAAGHSGISLMISIEIEKLVATISN